MFSHCPMLCDKLAPLTHSLPKTFLYCHVFACLRVLEGFLGPRLVCVCCYSFVWKTAVGEEQKQTDPSVFVYLHCPYTSGPFPLPQTTLLHVLVAVGHKLHLKTGLCWISIKSCQYSFFTLQLCSHPQGGNA